MSFNFNKAISIEEEVKLQATIQLMPCQKNLSRIPDCTGRGTGVDCQCKIYDAVTFYDDVYLSNYVITETCKKECPALLKPN